MAIMLIGDAEYYGMFGFDASHARQWDLPGPFERHRLLVRVPAGVKLPAAGAVGPRRGAWTAISLPDLRLEWPRPILAARPTWRNLGRASAERRIGKEWFS